MSAYKEIIEQFFVALLGLLLFGMFAFIMWFYIRSWFFPARAAAYELKRLQEMFEKGDYSGVVSRSKTALQKGDAAAREETLRLLVLSYFNLEQYNLAEQTSLALTETSVNPSDWFNLVTSATLNKNIALGERAYQKTVALYKDNEAHEDLPLPQVYCYYMQALRDVKEYEKAFAQLEKLKDLYCALKITDSHFLYMRGMPFFTHTLRESKEILENIDQSKALKFIADLKAQVDEDGAQDLAEFEKEVRFKS